MQPLVRLSPGPKRLFGLGERGGGGDLERRPRHPSLAGERSCFAPNPRQMTTFLGPLRRAGSQGGP